MVRLASPNRDDILDEVREELRFLQVPQRPFDEALAEILQQQVPLEELDYLIYVDQEEQKLLQNENLIYDLQTVEFESVGWVKKALHYLMNEQKIFDDVQLCYQVLVQSKIEALFLQKQEEFGDIYVTETNPPFHAQANSKLNQNQSFQQENQFNSPQQQKFQQFQGYQQQQNLNWQYQQQFNQNSQENDNHVDFSEDFMDAHDISAQIYPKNFQHNIQQQQYQFQDQNFNQFQKQHLLEQQNSQQQFFNQNLPQLQQQFYQNHPDNNNNNNINSNNNNNNNNIDTQNQQRNNQHQFQNQNQKYQQQQYQQQQNQFQQSNNSNISQQQYQQLQNQFQQSNNQNISQQEYQQQNQFYQSNIQQQEDYQQQQNQFQQSNNQNISQQEYQQQQIQFQQSNNQNISTQKSHSHQSQKLNFWEVKLLENLKGVITMMLDFGAERAHIQKALIQFPELISHDVQDLYTSLQFLLSNGMPRKHGCLVLCQTPQVLYLPLYRLKKKLYMLKEIGVDLKSFLKRSMVFRGAFPEMDKWEQSVKFLHGLGLLKDPNILAKGPRLLFLHVPNAVHVLQYLVDIGVPQHKVYQVIRDYPEVLTCSVKYKLKREVSTLCKILSVSKEEVARMIVRLPQILSYNMSGDSMQKKIEFLKREFGKSFKKQLMEYPSLLSLNLFERIGPRMAFLKHLKLRDFNLKRALHYSEENFSLNICNSSIQYYLMFKYEWQESAGLEWRPSEQKK